MGIGRSAGTGTGSLLRLGIGRFEGIGNGGVVDTAVEDAGVCVLGSYATLMISSNFDFMLGFCAIPLAIFTS